jgi:hypothetical protein
MVHHENPAIESLGTKEETDQRNVAKTTLALAVVLSQRRNL